jgi:hypothetical protein
VTTHRFFLVWEGPGQWVGRCKGCYGRVVTGRPAAYEVVEKRALAHVKGKPVKKPAKKVAAKKAA